MLRQYVEFPGLGLEFSFDRVAFYLPSFLGGFGIYWYGIIIAFGFALAIIYAMSRTETFGVDPDRLFDVLLVGIITGILGARLFYVVFSDDPTIKFFSFRDGGLAIYGGIIFGILGGLITAKIRDVKFLPALDLVSGSFLIGQSIGRWGNFINVEAFGGNTDLPWGMIGPETTRQLSENQAALEALGMVIDPNKPVHPTFFYESLWCLIGFLIILFLTKRRRFDGQLSLVYLGWYGLGRFFIEGLRTDSLLLGSVRVSRLIAILCFIAAVLIYIAVFSRIQREGDPEFLKLYVDTKDGQAVLAGTYYASKAVEKEEQEAEELEEEAEELEEKAEKLEEKITAEKEVIQATQAEKELEQKQKKEKKDAKKAKKEEKEELTDDGKTD